jgi:hypothetical protein
MWWQSLTKGMSHFEEYQYVVQGQETLEETKRKEEIGKNL